MQFSTILRSAPVAAAAMMLFNAPTSHAQCKDERAMLVGFAALPADTFAAGPESGTDSGDGTPIAANGRTAPFPGQPVQGFSGVQFAPNNPGSYWFLTDNGFGGQQNSADYLLRIYQVKPEFRTLGFHWNKPNQSGDVTVEDFIQFADPAGLVPFPIVNEGSADRLLTGADFDVESFVVAGNGDIWVGEEFGPFLLHFNAQGELLQAPIPTPEVSDGELSAELFVRAPQNPYLDGAEPNLSGSRGFEGMAFSPDRRFLYPLLEGTVAGDPAGSLRIYEFDLEQGKYSGFVGFFETTPGHAIGDFTPVNKNEFLIIERDGTQGDPTGFKRIFKVDFSEIDGAGYVAKEEVANLMDVNDPFDLNEDGATLFTFPFVTIEDVLVLDRHTILVANDNNYPFSLGRGPDIDNNEIIKLRLSSPLKLDRRLVPNGRKPR